jgi:hypothetical protein
MTNLQKIVEEIFTPEELALIDSGEYRPGRAVLDAKIDLAVAAEREACAKVCEEEQFELTEDVSGKNGLQHFDAGCRSCAEMIRKRGEV